MQITKEFLATEIADLHAEIGKAQAFLLKAQGTIEAYQMLINRLDAPEPEQDNGSDNPQ
jgi:hypothetical protein